MEKLSSLTFNNTQNLNINEKYKLRISLLLYILNLDLLESAIPHLP